MTAVESYSDEHSFHAAWCAAQASLADGASSPTALALAGGELADRLAWVFVSGYQAAVRRCFPEFTPPSGWTCLAAAEAGAGEPCVLESVGDAFRLSGEKSWVAGAGVLARLVVLVSEGDGICFVPVAADAAGVKISLPRTPGFLAEMTQGVANFDAVVIRPEEIIREPERRLWFRGAEPLYVLLALNGCLRARAVERGDDELVALTDTAIEFGATLPDLLAEKAAILPGLARFRTLTARVLGAADRIVDQTPSLSRSFEADGRLFSMFGIKQGEEVP
jgi:alkylation response protein AidB-like acyl-CoA dehydrogenase